MLAPRIDSWPWMCVTVFGIGLAIALLDVTVARG
jgi:hypothetical protein